MQGFLPVEASIFDVEVWGLGGKRARDVQSSYKKREELFTNQRRKVINIQFGHYSLFHRVLSSTINIVSVFSISIYRLT